MADGMAIDGVVSILLAEYGVDEQRIRNDLRELIEQLAARSLVKISEDEDSPS